MTILLLDLVASFLCSVLLVVAVLGLLDAGFVFLLACLLAVTN
jgi:hypothetical protein